MYARNDGSNHGRQLNVERRQRQAKQVRESAWIGDTVESALYVFLETSKRE